ncbi:MAG: hypothetical protein JKY09_02065 [Crocinitomicaceae bacterium]|nr:hypothetical protein [Crocinitomicaceae bacterium]
MEDIYLTLESKEYYLKDFNENVLTCKDNTWRLDQGLRDLLIKINTNGNFQTLYSKLHSDKKLPTSRNDSYIQFAYKKDVEQKLFKGVLPRITKKYCGFADDTKCFYDFLFPHENYNYRDKESAIINLGCLSDENYFKINHIRLFFNSDSVKKHDLFWQEVCEELTAIE